MAWETRGNGRYYYRKRWMNGTCQSEYIGAGLIAELMAERDRIERELAAQQKALIDAINEPDELLQLAGDWLDVLTKGVLLAAGYHQHKRQWRQRYATDNGSSDQDEG